MLLKSTTRHVHIYAATVSNGELIPTSDSLTLNIDPDHELAWNDAAITKVQEKFSELVASYSGEDLIEYNLRRIGSDLEHFIRALLLKGEISYNLNARVQNYSLGVPRFADA
jgi:NAD(P)H-quinone oxidoreductase subunit M